MKVAKFLCVALLVVLVACDKESNEPTRSFRMGFTPFPAAISLPAVERAYARIGEHADIINHHFDEGLPWDEAYRNAPYPDRVNEDLSYRKQHTPPGHKVYVSLCALNGSRNGLALRRGEAENMPLPEPWSQYAFNDEHVKTAYLNYCKHLIDFFQPDYFNMSVEANLLYFTSESQWPAFLEFHEFVYDGLKAAYPQLTIFSSVTGSHVMPGFHPEKDHVQQRLAMMQVLENSDMYALSFYGYISSYRGNPWPDNTFDQLFGLSEKPFAIAETGYPAESFTINSGGTDVQIDSDPEKQNKYFVDLLKAAERRQAEFVINFTVEDYDSLWKEIGAKNDITIAWRDTGLISEKGEQRTAFSTWDAWFRRTLQLSAN